MKDKEMAKEFANEKCKDCYMCSYSEHKNPYKICQRRKDRKQAFLAGLKAVRPQWHKVSEHDYPDTSRIVLCRNRKGLYFTACNKIDNSWEIFIGANIINVNEYLECQWFVDEWCEIPTFDKE